MRNFLRVRFKFASLKQNLPHSQARADLWHPERYPTSEHCEIHRIPDDQSSATDTTEAMDSTLSALVLIIRFVKTEGASIPDTVLAMAMKQALQV
jgi:hypothetical protein